VNFELKTLLIVRTLQRT